MQYYLATWGLTLLFVNTFCSSMQQHTINTKIMKYSVLWICVLALHGTQLFNV